MQQNDTINARIRWIRTELHLSQAVFASQIGITQTGLSSLENGKNGSFPKVRPVVVQSICSRFGVNERWLLTGEPPIWQANDQKSFEDVVEGHDLTREELTFLRTFIAQPPASRKAILRFAIDFAKSLGAAIPDSQVRIPEHPTEEQFMDAAKATWDDEKEAPTSAASGGSA